MKTFIEYRGDSTNTPLHRIDVVRDVIGKYGQVQYTIQFVFNEGNTPPGAGDIAILDVVQAAATSGQIFAPTIAETQRGSNPIEGNYKIDLHSPDGPRLVKFNEPPERLKFKLEELMTVGSVRVTRSNYPSSTTGGWGDAAVAANSRGGFEYQIHFLRNPGVYNGYSFPPGSGNIEPLTIDFTPVSSVTNADALEPKMVGENINVEPLTYNDGSTPIEGTFTVGYGDASTSPIAYNQQPIETKYLLEALPTVGEVSTASRFRLMEKLPGVYATLDRDSSTVSVTYDSGMTTICGDIAQCDWDVQQFLNPGALLRIG